MANIFAFLTVFAAMVTATKIPIGTPYIGICAANEDLDAGLCYPKCKPNYTGIGLVCWGRPSPSWVDCPMGDAVTHSHCAAVLADQVLSVVVPTANISTRFAGSSVKVLASAANPAQVSKLRSLWLKALPHLAKKDLQYARTAIALMAVLDKTGLLDVVAADMFPTCDKIYFECRTAQTLLCCLRRFAQPASYICYEPPASTITILLDDAYKFYAAWRTTFEEASATACFFSLYTNETYCSTRIETDAYTISQAKH
ncbi:hypothetical protein H257_19322 [Aphanomyces astaci]|uniref:Secreted protein n=1 Tax=Aphanomyces astaci TaxID=112090 RepID=W4FAB0_APHAT|nr:hypothetical protein H257_19322 [Aphanomyces astaci]ETV63746.1 hypothetical protein H257_19322 [Aphanomyces astaci]|eukprot:XP_009846769.1 hypothetical protein H257_19322 [Aphanomyces astaci]